MAYPIVLRRPFVAIPLLVTLAALVAPGPGPFDARDYASVPAAHLDYPLAAIPFEPLLAPAHLLAGAPDVRLAFLSCVLWAILGAGLWGYRKGTAMGGVRAASLAALLSLVYLAFTLLAAPPGWRLVVEESDLLAADLQSHTFGSHDGLVDAAYNLAWHRQRGYAVVALTEHYDPAGAFRAMEEAARDAPAVIPGIEVRGDEGEFLLGIGLRPDRQIPAADGRPGYTQRFIEAVQRDHGGAVIALAWQLEPRQIRALADAGVDAFEIANMGHPDIPAPVRQEMLAVAKSHNVVLLASTDWHGWGGAARTWSLFRVDGAARLTAAERAAAVVTILRDRRGDAVTPLVAGRLGPPPLWRAIFSPWVEAFRYAGELSPLRVAAWWGWGTIAWLISTGLRRRELRLRSLVLPSFLLAAGGAVAARGSELIAYRLNGLSHPFATEIGWQAVVVGLAGVAVGLRLVWVRRTGAGLGLKEGHAPAEGE